ncbi:hypothetical protein [Rhodococcus aetherivorans]|uniref:hypothetical protein n=1 Tax=Rhodococcus aetherivorans TaxID=191292 RepID=UPI0002D22533|nr:hypothetical protein [Rhodococcus aetherivorans]CCW14620.1 hypothetical protein EBESD8_51900 [Rhodococcus aetherivorans]
MSETFYLPRDQQAQLVELLDQVPFLVEQLAITICRQDRLGAGPRISRGKQASPLPYNVGASDAADALHDELASWVRLVSEQRQLDYHEDRDDTISLARWLQRWHIALALTEGAETALLDIETVILDARRAIDRPPPRRPHIDPTLINEATNQLLNARGIEHLARELDTRYRNLNRRRVHALHEAGRITPAANIEGTHLYRIGDVLEAHLTHPIRRKTA